MPAWTYDLFIAYAGPDRPHAERLYEALEDLADVFIDTKCLVPGDNVPDRLRRAQIESRITVAVVSRRSLDSVWQVEEIVRGIDLARRAPDGHRVVPVFLEGMPLHKADIPGGLAMLAGLDVDELGGLEAVADKLRDLLDRLEEPGQREVGRTSVTYRETLGAALRLDRSQQWREVVRVCTDRDHAVFLLYGHRRQNVGFFVDRLSWFLDRESRRPHLPVFVRFKLDQSPATVGADWENHLSVALAQELKVREGTAAELLGQLGRTKSVFLVLGLKPLEALTEVQQRGLKDFLTVRLPALIEQAATVQPVRALLTVEYDLFESSLAWHAEEWFYEASRSRGRQSGKSRDIDYVILPETELPPWSEVKSYVQNHPSRPSRAAIEAIKLRYEELTSGHAYRFKDITDLLDQELQDA